MNSVEAQISDTPRIGVYTLLDLTRSRTLGGTLRHTAFLGHRLEGGVDNLWLITRLGVTRASRPEVGATSPHTQFDIEKFVDVKISYESERTPYAPTRRESRVR